MASEQLINSVIPLIESLYRHCLDNRMEWEKIQLGRPFFRDIRSISIPILVDGQNMPFHEKARPLLMDYMSALNLMESNESVHTAIGDLLLMLENHQLFHNIPNKTYTLTRARWTRDGHFIVSIDGIQEENLKEKEKWN